MNRIYIRLLKKKHLFYYQARHRKMKPFPASPVASTSSQPNTGMGAVVYQGRLQLGCEGAASRQQKVGPGSLHWSPEHSLLSSSGVTGKVAASTSKQEREQVGWVWGQGI